jgi:hypothetical protein
MAESRSASRCSPKGAVTVERSAETRVFRWRNGTYACSAKSNRRERLDSRWELVETRTVVGRYVGYVEWDSGFDKSGEPYGTVHSFDARTGRTLVNASAYRLQQPTAEGRIADFAMLQDGTVIWLAKNVRLGGQPWELYISPRRGEDLIDSSPGIEPGSVAASRRFVYWTRDNVPQRVPIVNHE